MAFVRVGSISVSPISQRLLTRLATLRALKPKHRGGIQLKLQQGPPHPPPQTPQDHTESGSSRSFWTHVKSKVLRRKVNSCPKTCFCLLGFAYAVRARESRCCCIFSFSFFPRFRDLNLFLMKETYRLGPAQNPNTFRSCQNTFHSVGVVHVLEVRVSQKYFLDVRYFQDFIVQICFVGIHGEKTIVLDTRK